MQPRPTCERTGSDGPRGRSEDRLRWRRRTGWVTILAEITLHTDEDVGTAGSRRARTVRVVAVYRNSCRSRCPYQGWSGAEEGIHEHAEGDGDNPPDDDRPNRFSARADRTVPVRLTRSAVDVRIASRGCRIASSSFLRLTESSVFRPGPWGHPLELRKVNLVLLQASAVRWVQCRSPTTRTLPPSRLPARVLVPVPSGSPHSGHADPEMARSSRT